MRRRGESDKSIDHWSIPYRDGLTAEVDVRLFSTGINVRGADPEYKFKAVVAEPWCILEATDIQQLRTLVRQRLEAAGNMEWKPYLAVIVEAGTAGYSRTEYTCDVQVALLVTPHEFMHVDGKRTDTHRDPGTTGMHDYDVLSRVDTDKVGAIIPDTPETRAALADIEARLTGLGQKLLALLHPKQISKTLKDVNLSLRALPPGT